MLKKPDLKEKKTRTLDEIVPEENPRRSKRPKNEPSENFNPGIFYRGPNYKLKSNTKGGCNSLAVISCNILGTGTNSKSTNPSGINDLKNDYGVVSGHLLNAEFGGSSKSSNVVILSDSGNGNHESFDNRIKDAAGSIKKLYDILHKLYIDRNLFCIGIRLNITTNGKYHKSPFDDMPTGLICDAKLQWATRKKVDDLPNFNDLDRDTPFLDEIKNLHKKSTGSDINPKQLKEVQTALLVVKNDITEANKSRNIDNPVPKPKSKK